MENFTHLEAIKRLVWRFKQNKTFTPNENDVNALNVIIRHINEENKQVYHIQFAKLFLLTVFEYLPNYGHELTINKISEILSTDLSILYAKVQDRLNSLNLSDYFLSKGILPSNDTLTANRNETNNNKSNNKDKLKKLKPDEVINAIDGYTFDEVVMLMNASINYLLKSYNKL